MLIIKLGLFIISAGITKLELVNLLFYINE